MARADARGPDDALRVAAELLAEGPPHAYAARIAMHKSTRGARWHVKVVWQVRGRPLERASARRESIEG